MAAVAGTSVAEKPGRRFAARRLYRLLSLSLGITTLLTLVMLIPVIPEQARVLTPGYTVLAIVVVGGPAVIALCIFRVARVRVLRVVWRVQALGMVALYAGIPFVALGSHIPQGPQSLWILEVEVVAGCAAVLAWRTRTLIVYAIVWQCLMLGIGVFCGEGSVAGPVMGDVVRELVTVAMFTCLAAALLRAGELLDATVDNAVAEARLAARADVRRTGRRTLEMLIHDRIIVALLAYAAGAGTDRSAAEARSALTSIKRGHLALTDDTDRSPRDLAWELQALTTQLDTQTRFDYTADGTAAIPANVSFAIAEALSEALRNSIRHAPANRAVSRQVHATLSPDRLEVLVLDDGKGFDLAAVGAARLGIRHGIVRRMNDLPGGSANVSSRPGYGTMVTLRWSRP